MQKGGCEAALRAFLPPARRRSLTRRSRTLAGIGLPAAARGLGPLPGVGCPVSFLLSQNLDILLPGMQLRAWRAGCSVTEQASSAAGQASSAAEQAFSAAEQASSVAE
jgi:hypothetical protein